MEIKFKYDGKIISTPNLEKKLKRMKISIDDIEIIKDEIKQIPQESSEEVSPRYYFKNINNGYTITSIYPTIPEWVENKEEWKKV